VFSELHSKAAQTTVAGFYRNLSNLPKKEGYNIANLKRESSSDYQSVMYSQSGFGLSEKRPVTVRLRPLQQDRLGQNPIPPPDS